MTLLHTTLFHHLLRLSVRPVVPPHAIHHLRRIQLADETAVVRLPLRLDDPRVVPVHACVLALSLSRMVYLYPRVQAVVRHGRLRAQVVVETVSPRWRRTLLMRILTLTHTTRTIFTPCPHLP